MNTDFLNKKVIPLEEMMPLIEEHLSRGKSVRITPKGISMLPMLREKSDSVVLSPKPEKIKKYDLPLYKRDDDKYILHRVVSKKEPFCCVGDNQFEIEFGVRYDQIIAVVTSFNRGDKEYSVNDFSYKFYCRFWHYSRPFRRVWRGVKRRLKSLFK